jgi:NAD(P)H-hydrate epimerase
MASLSQLLFSAAEVRAMDRAAIEGYGIPGYQLMQRAGQATYAAARQRWPKARRWLILCGAGNNAGDGYVIAALARAGGLQVRVMALSSPAKLRGDAAQAWQDFAAAGGSVEEFDPARLRDSELLMDALLGTGLDRPVSGNYLQAIEAINGSGKPLVAVDIPSGLHGDSGQILGAASRADLTVTFVGRKRGLYLGAGPDCVGEVLFDDLAIPAQAIGKPEASLALYQADQLRQLLQPRRASAHKGLFGHVLVIGGNAGLGGAVRLAAEAALRSGAGLVTVATRPENVAAVTGYRPELMCLGVQQPADLDAVLARASVIALGPGLGQDDWSRALFQRVLEAPQRKIIDADALNLLAASPRCREDWILTPHPGEAARMLGLDTASVQADRLSALRELNRRYGGVTILKGRGSLVGAADQLPWLIDAGNPGMATAGMGDVLTGITAGLLAQYPQNLFAAAAAAAQVHALAGDRAARAGQRGLLAGDVIAELRACLNPGD